VRALFAENKVRFARVERLWSAAFSHNVSVHSLIMLDTSVHITRSYRTQHQRKADKHHSCPCNKINHVNEACYVPFYCTYTVSEKIVRCLIKLLNLDLTG